jgi:hypothetical protein
MINEFKALIKKRGGLSKTNRFSVNINLPSGVGTDNGRDLTLLCESANIPGKQITTIEYSLYGHTRKIPSGFLLEDLTLVFNITNDYYVKRIFDEWQAIVISTKDYSLAYNSDYQVDLEVTQLNEKDEPVWSTTLIGAYPIQVASIVLDNTSEGGTQKLNVTMAFTDIKKPTDIKKQ